MAENQNTNQTTTRGYGYTSDDVRVNNFKFGLNSNTFLTKFGFNPNGGSEGAAMDCLDVIFNINGTEKSYRMFPVTKVFSKEGGEITDTNSKEYIDAFNDLMGDFTARVSHICGCFVDKELVKVALSKNFGSFKEYVDAATHILPTNFSSKELDIFLQYQWQISGDNKVTYLEIPKKMKYGRWLAPHQKGTWIPIIKENPTDDEGQALRYGNADTATKEDRDGKEVITAFKDYHPFVKSGWFMKSNFATQKKIETNEAASAAMNAPAPTSEGAAPVAPAAPSSW